MPNGIVFIGVCALVEKTGYYEKCFHCNALALATSVPISTAHLKKKVLPQEGGYEKDMKSMVVTKKITSQILITTMQFNLCYFAIGLQSLGFLR